MQHNIRYSQYFFIIILSTFYISYISAQNTEDLDSILPVKLGSTVKKAVYHGQAKQPGPLYSYLWGKHYRSLYYKPVSVKTVSLASIFGGLTIKSQVPKLHGLILESKNNDMFFLRPIGGSTIFMESDFFRKTYRHNDFKNTYIGDFIGDAYTIINPYTFIVADMMASTLALPSHVPHLVYISESQTHDTIADGSNLLNKLVSVTKMPRIDEQNSLTTVGKLLNLLHTDDTHQINKPLYIRTRLFDMLIGDWNKIPEAWYWVANQTDSITVYDPVVIDRSHSFTKADGKFFKTLIQVLGLDFINDYNGGIKNTKKFNQLGFALDIALTQSCNEEEWLEEAAYIQEKLNDKTIEQAFRLLPAEIQDDETARIKADLRERLKNLKKIAARYYKELQKTPVITGTNKADKIVINEDQYHNLNISRYNTKTNQLEFKHKYQSKETKEIWLYSLDGDDNIEVNKQYNPIPLLLIGGKGQNKYTIEHGHKTSIYEYKSQKERLDTLSNVKTIFTNNGQNTLDYNYENLKHTKLSITPIGIYDSDLGLNIGTSVSYTVYGFGRTPYSRRHQFSYDYVNGFTYQGIFPDYDSKRSLHVSAYIGSPAYFSNFFGFGNNTPGYKDEKNKYNRVNIHKYILTPALFYNIDSDQEANIAASLQAIKISNPKERDRFINQIYDDGNSIFDSKYYIDISANYKLKKSTNTFISKYKAEATAGWTINVGDPCKNFPYISANLGADFKITDRITFATLLKGKKILTDKYEFHQSATTELRGFRNNRFIGKSSVFQYSDIRLDMGKLYNPFTSLLYGVFVGIDYGRVWYPKEDSGKWHSSYGGGFWLTVFRNFTGKFSYFASTDTGRFNFTLGMGF